MSKMIMTRVEAIRKMYDAEEGDYIILLDGERINSWVIVDYEGIVYNDQNMDDAELIKAYEECQQWEAPNYEEVG